MPSRADIEDIFRLTPMQQGMLFHMLAHPESQLYFEQMTCQLVGELQAEAFAAAWQRAVDRHPSLRTSFHWQGLSHPVQMVHRTAKIEVEIRDWQSLAATERSSQLSAFLAADRRRGFDLAQPPLSRLHLLRLSPERTWMVWSTVHLVIDAWSVSILLREVLDHYQALLGGQPRALAAGRSYRDFVAWTAAQDLGVAELYWRRKLAGFRTSNSLQRASVGARPQSPEPAPAGAAEGHDRLHLRLSTEATGALENLVRRHRLTLHSLAAGAWALYLGWIGDTEDVVFGTVCSGRPPSLPGVEEVVGLFINTLPVRLRLTADQPFPAWLQAAQADLVQLRRFEWTPLGKVLEWSEIGSGQDLFESIVVFFNVVDTTLLEASDLKIREVQDIARSNFPLVLRCYPERQLKLEMIFDRSRFTAAAVTLQLQELASVLELIGRRPEDTVGSLRSSLEQAGREQLLERQRQRKAAFGERLKSVKPGAAPATGAKATSP